MLPWSFALCYSEGIGTPTQQGQRQAKVEAQAKEVRYFRVIILYFVLLNRLLIRIGPLWVKCVIMDQKIQMLPKMVTRQEVRYLLLHSTQSLCDIYTDYHI